MNRFSRQVVVLTGMVFAASLSGFAQASDEQAVLAPIRAMFDGMSQRDAAAMKAPTLPGGTMVLMRDGEPAQMTFEAFAERVGKPGTTKIEERIHKPVSRIARGRRVVW